MPRPGAKHANRRGGEPPTVPGAQAPLPSLEEVHPRHIAYVRRLIARFGISPAVPVHGLGITQQY